MLNLSIKRRSKGTQLLVYVYLQVRDFDHFILFSEVVLLPHFKYSVEYILEKMKKLHSSLANKTVFITHNKWGHYSEVRESKNYGTLKKQTLHQVQRWIWICDIGNCQFKFKLRLIGTVYVTFFNSYLTVCVNNLIIYIYICVYTKEQ